MIRNITFLLTLAVMALSGQTSSAADKSLYDDGGFGVGGMSNSSYIALDDPTSEDPSAIEPAAGDEDQTTSDDQNPEDNSNAAAPADEQPISE